MSLPCPREQPRIPLANMDTYSSTANGGSSLPKQNEEAFERLTILPPLSKEDFSSRQTLEKKVEQFAAAILENFPHEIRNQITIIRNHTMVRQKMMRALLVIAPYENGNGIKKIYTQGITLNNRTIFPLGARRFSHQNFRRLFPKKINIKFENLPFICRPADIYNLLQLPKGVEPAGAVNRETKKTQAGEFYTGHARMLVNVNDEEALSELTEGSHKQKTEKKEPMA